MLFGVLVVLILLPIIILNFNKKFRSTFSKTTSDNFEIIIEVLLGFIYFFIIIFSTFSSYQFQPFPIILFGAVLYFVGITLTYIGYYTFFVYRGNLINKGIYKVSRNPTYLFSYIAILGIAILSGSYILLILLILLIIFTHRIITNEECFLKKVYGNKYLKYKRDTPRYL